MDWSLTILCSVLIDRCPVMRSGWSELLKGVNKIVGNLKKHNWKLHFGLHLLDSRRFTLQEFENTPRELSKHTPLGKGELDLYDRLCDEVIEVSKYIKAQKLRRPKARIVVFSNTKDKVSDNRAAEVRNLVMRAARNGIIVRFAYGSEISEMVVQKIGRYTSLYWSHKIAYMRQWRPENDRFLFA